LNTVEMGLGNSELILIVVSSVVFILDFVKSTREYECKKSMYSFIE
tara:strand:+ start:395 stop:532 length:138 start_codon:yes stop_codon:yes gene_type:complete